MKQNIYILILVFVLCSCDKKTKKQNVINNFSVTRETATEISDEIGDSIYKIGDFLFEAKKNAKFEFIKTGQFPGNNTKGDTLYSDDQIVMLGDIREITSSGIYKKFTFKSKFNNFKADKIYQGKPAPPDFATDPAAKEYRTRIEEGCEGQGVNFAGHYTIVEWGCGTVSEEMAIVDRISGKIIYSQIPFDTADGHSGSQYHSDSRMLIINIESLSEFDGYEPGYRRFDSWRKPSVYVIIDGRLNQIE